MPRLFFAIDLPPDIKDRLGPVAQSLGRIGPHVRPVGRGSFHLTSLFLGEQPEHVIPDLCSFATQAVAPARPCSLAIGPPGFFPRVSFLTLAGEIETLAMISHVLKETCGSYLERPEDRPFAAHVTLARLKRTLRPDEKAGIIQVLSPFEGLSWVASEMILFRSDLVPKGAVYTSIERFPFGCAENAG